MRKKQEDDFMTRAILCNGLARQIVSGMAALIDKKHKFISLENLYPNYFGKETRQKTAVEIWDQFLRR